MKLTFGQIKATIARLIPVCEDDVRVARYTNQACQRLLYKGLYAGCYGRFTISVVSGCITWPRLIETIESVTRCCNGTGVVRNQWYEFLETGPGLVESGSGVSNTMVDRGTACVYRDLTGGTNSYVRVYPGDASDVGKTITIQGWDYNGQWIRTLDGSTWIDGEKITLALPYVQSTKKFTSITGVIRQATNTSTRLYEYDSVLLTEVDIALYDPDETVPQYRRSYLTDVVVDGTSSNVTVMAKLRHIPVSVDNDWIIPPCEGAIKLMVQAILKEENDLLQEAVGYEQKATMVLNEHTNHYLGDAVAQIRVVGQELWGGHMRQMY